MASKTILVDDYDGYIGDDVARRDFEVGGKKFVIDLGDGNAKLLDEIIASLGPFLAQAVEVKQAGRARKAADDGAARLQGYTNADVRAWAREQGVDVSVRGKIADEVYDLFVAAHPDARPAEQPAEG